MDEVFIDAEGHIKKSLMRDEHQLIKIIEKTPELSNIGKIVRGDTNSNILTFEMNRYYDGEDILNKDIRFIIKNDLGVFVRKATDLQYNNSKIRFSWVLDYEVTHKAQIVTVSIMFFGKSASDLPYSLKTVPFTIKIEDTLEATDMVIEEPENWFVDIENRLSDLEQNGSGVSEWSKINEKPFSTLSDQFEVSDGELNIVENGQTIQVSNLPTPSIEYNNVIYQYIGENTDDYINGYYYKCINTDGNYIWTNINVQPEFKNTNYVTLEELETHAKSSLHITPAERSAWNAKPTKSEIPTKLVHLTGDSEQVAILNKLGENEDGFATYNGQLIVSGVVISKDKDNIIKNNSDGLLAKVDLSPYAKTSETISLSSTRTNSAIDDAIEKKHNHKNSELLNKLSVNDNDIICYNGTPVASNIPLSAKSNNGIQNLNDGLYVDSSSHHTHNNSEQLNKIGEKDGNITYDGKSIITQISKTEGNAITEELDGLYVPISNVKISPDDGNKLVMSENGLYVSETTYIASSDTDNILTIDQNKKIIKVPKTKISTDTGNAIIETSNGLYVQNTSYVASDDEDNIVVINEKEKTIKVPKTKISTEVNNAISDNNGLYVKKVEISDEPNNAIVETDGKLFVAKGSVVIGTQNDNQIQNTESGLYVPKHNDYVKSVNNQNPKDDGNITINLDDVLDGTSRKMYELETNPLNVESLWK